MIARLRAWARGLPGWAVFLSWLLAAAAVFALLEITSGSPGAAGLPQVPGGAGVRVPADTAAGGAAGRAPGHATAPWLVGFSLLCVLVPFWITWEWLTARG